MKKKYNKYQHIIKIISYFLILCCTFLILCYITVQTGIGKRILTTQISQMLSTPQQQVQLSRLRGHIPWNMQLEHLRIMQGEVLALEATDASLHWSPWALLRGRITIHKAQIGDIAWHKPLLPFKPASTSPARTKPLIFPNVAIGNITLPHLFIEKNIFTTTPLHVTGNITGDIARPMTLKGNVQVTKGIPTEFTFVLTPSSRSQFMMNAHLKEAAGGLIGGMLKLPNTQDIALDTNLKGDLASINGALTLALGQELLADINITTHDDNHITLEGHGTFPAFMPISHTLPSPHWRINGNILSKEGTWDVQHFSLALPYESDTTRHYAALNLQGSIHLPTRTTPALTLTLNAENMQPFIGTSGKGDARLTVKGSPADYRVDAEAGYMNEHAHYKLQAQGDIKEMNAISFKEIKLHKDSTLLAKGTLTYAFPTGKLDTSFEGMFDNTLFTTDLLNKEAKIAWDINAKGALRDLPINAKFTLDNWQPPAALHHLTTEDSARFTSALRLTPNTLTIKEATLTAGELTANMGGAFPLTPHKKAKTLTLSVTHPAHEPLNAALHLLRQNNALTLPLVQVTTGKTTIEAQEIMVKKAGIEGIIHINAPDIAALAAWAGMKEGHGMAESTIHLTPKQIDAQGTMRDVLLSEIELGIETLDFSLRSPSLSSPKDYDINIQARNAIWQTLRADTLNATLKQGAFAFALAGTAHGNDVALNSTGNLEKKAVRLASLTGNYGSYPLTLQHPTTLTMTEKGAWELSPFALTSNATTLEGAGTVKGKKVAVHASIQQFPLRPLLVDRFPTMGEVTANAEATITGTAAAPLMRINADVTAEEMSKLSKAGAPPDILRLHFTSTLEPQGKNSILTSRATLKSGEDMLAEGTLDLPMQLAFAPFTFTLHDTRPLSGKLHSEVALSRFNSWLAPLGHRLVANLKSDTTVKGTLKDPITEGTIALEKVSYTHLTYGLCVREGEMKLQLTPTRQFIIRRLTATGDRGRGTLQGSGMVDMAARQIALQLTAKDAALFCSSMVDGAISGNMNTTGSMDALTTQGALALGKTSITLPSNGAAAIPHVEKRYRHEALNKEAIAAAPTIPMGFDIDIDIPKQLFVRGRGLDAEFGGRFHITGNAQAPHINGKLKNRRGRLALLGSTMTITEGIVEFLNGNPHKPYLQLTGTTSTNNTTITTQLAGALTTPKLTLSSTPALPQDEILALLLFGRPLDKITPLQALQLAQAAASLAKGDSGTGMLGSVRDALGVDSLNIGDGGDGNPTVGAGKYITDKIYVGIEQGTTPESRRLSTEIELSPTVTGKTSTNSQGEPSVGLEWRYDY
jgi:autotransporter translocation and assembly factor TamB